MKTFGKILIFLSFTLLACCGPSLHDKLASKKKERDIKTMSETYPFLTLSEINIAYDGYPKEDAKIIWDKIE